MATFSISNIRVSAISASVPSAIAKNIEHPSISQDDITKFIESTGVAERRVAAKNECASDLCIAAAEKIFSVKNVDKNDIEILIFISQTGDYRLPVTSAIIQDRLGLSKSCIAFDIPLGCSGYVYGLSVISGMMNACNLKKGLLLAGDTISKEVSSLDKSAEPLFGDAGTATLLEYDENCAPILFDLGTDGSGYKSIIIPNGGARNAFSADSLIMREFEGGIKRNDCHIVLDGMDVFAFGINQAPKTVNTLMQHFSLKDDDVDYYIFHQANKMMNDRINKKLKLLSEKTPSSLKHFGNTSSATIPLTIISNLEHSQTANARMILCGFGVGLSWGTVYLKFDEHIFLSFNETTAGE